MRKFSITTEIAAPTERVWDVMSDVDRWHEWTPSITSVTREEGRPLEMGTRVAIRQPKLPSAKWTVTSLVPGEQFAWTSKAPGITVVGTHVVVVGDKGGSRATLSIEIEGMLGALWESLTREITERYVSMEARGLKARSEDPSYRHTGA